MSRSRLVAVIGVVLSVSVRADVILSSTVLNNALKSMELLRQQMTGAPPDARAAAVFQLGTEADALAALINNEVAAHGSQEKLLIDLAVSRTAALGVNIAHNDEKKKFFYDNAAFREYLTLMPGGPRAADAEFKLLEGDFFQMKQDNVDAVHASSGRKAAFLRRFPRHARSSDVSLMLSIDYRDLFRHFETRGDTANSGRYLALTRKQLAATSTKYRDTEEATIAAEILRRLNAELRRPR